MANTDSKSRPVDEESRTTTEYRECWRNHAVLAGGSAVDGCGEFTPKGDRGTKEAFICEACGCHRNFHRKQSVKNGVVILDTHHSPPPYRLYGVSTWVEKNASGFNPFSSLPLTSPPPPPPPPPCYLRASVSDQESLVYVPPPPPPPPCYLRASVSDQESLVYVPPPPPPPCYLRASVSDQESLVYVPPPPPPRKSEKKMKARKRPKRGT